MNFTVPALGSINLYQSALSLSASWALYTLFKEISSASSTLLLDPPWSSGIVSFALLNPKENEYVPVLPPF